MIVFCVCSLVFVLMNFYFAFAYLQWSTAYRVKKYFAVLILYPYRLLKNTSFGPPYTCFTILLTELWNFFNFLTK